MWSEKSVKVQNLTTLADILSVNPEVNHLALYQVSIGIMDTNILKG